MKKLSSGRDLSAKLNGTLTEKTNRNTSAKNRTAKEMYLSKSRYVPGLVKDLSGNNLLNSTISQNENKNGETLRGSQLASLLTAKQQGQTWAARSSVQARFEYAYGVNFDCHVRIYSF
jgi:hypothetical protein